MNSLLFINCWFTSVPCNVTPRNVRATPTRRPKLPTRVRLDRNWHNSRLDAPTQTDERPLFVMSVRGPFQTQIRAGFASARTQRVCVRCTPLPTPWTTSLWYIHPHFPSFPRKPPARLLSRPLAMGDASNPDDVVDLAASSAKRGRRPRRC